MPGSMRSWNLESAISAPVLPAETTQSASPSATARIARPKLDSLPCRKACAGGKSDLMTSSVWRISLRWLRKGSALSKGRSCFSLPKKRNRHSGLRWAARCAPSTTIPGALSPPMASNANRGDRTEGASRLKPLLFDIVFRHSGIVDGDNLARTIHAARFAQTMRKTRFAAIRTFARTHDTQGTVRATFAATHRRNLTFGNCH